MEALQAPEVLRERCELPAALDSQHLQNKQQREEGLRGYGEQSDPRGSRTKGHSP